MESKNIDINPSDEIRLDLCLNIIFENKWIVILFTVIITTICVFYSLTMPNVYKSNVIVVPSEDAGLKVPGQLGGLAALAGVNLDSASGNKTGLAVEILKSNDFLGRFIIKHDLFVSIMAAKGWDRETDKLLIDNEIYNQTSNTWVRKVDEPFKAKPSVQETIEEFNKLFAVKQEKTSSVIIISFEHYSPYLAKDILDKLVIMINEEMRQRDLDDANRSINYLNLKINETTVADLRQTLYSLVEDQTKTLMLANVKKEYVLKTIDPAFVAEKKERPQRSLIAFISLIVSFFISVGFVFLKRRFLHKNN